MRAPATPLPMRILVTGSSGHLGEALVRMLRADGADVVGLDVLPVAVHRRRRLDRRPRARARLRWTASTPSCTPRRCTSRTSARTAEQAFVDTNVTGTLNLLEEAVAAGVDALRLHQHDERVRARADARRRASPPPGSPRTSRRSRATSTASPRPRPRTSASSSTATTACPSWSCARRASSPRPTTATTCAPPTTTPT